MSYLPAGAIDTNAGAGPVIQGDPVVALLAQLNRFAGKTLSPPGGAAPRKYVSAEFTLGATAFDTRAASSAVAILIDRYQYAPLTGYDKSKVIWATSGLDDPKTFVLANLDIIVPQIALYGDSLNLPAAPVGITTRDPKFTPSVTPAQVVIGALAIGIGWNLLKKRKGRR